MDQKQMDKMAADREKERVPKIVFNCNPARAEGFEWGGIRYEVPPLGATGNPATMPTGAADHILRHSERAGSKKCRGWLTDDKAVYEKAKAQLEREGWVQNPSADNDDVVAAPTPAGEKSADYVQTLQAPPKENFFEKRAREKFLKTFGLWLDDHDEAPIYNKDGKQVKTPGTKAPVQRI